MPHSNPAGTVNVVHLTDAHLFASPEGSMLGLNTRDSLRHVVQQALRARNRIGIAAADAEHVATVGDLHAEPQFDHPQMCIERAAQVGQAFEVVGFQGEIALVLHPQKGSAATGWRHARRSCLTFN